MQEENTSSAEQLVQCMVCNNFMKSVTNSHLKKHGITCKEYKEKFPCSSMGNFSRFDSWRKSEENTVHMRNQNKRIFSTEEIREKRKEKSLAAMKTESYKKKLSESMKRYAQTPEGSYRLANKPVTSRMKMSNFQRWVEQFGVDEAIKRQLDWQSKNKIPSKSRDTKPELIVTEMLTLSGIRFIKQFSLPRIYCDFYLPDYNLIIEVDGDYWHANPDRFSSDDLIGSKKMKASQIWESDKKKSEKIIAFGYKLLRIWSSSLKNMTSQMLVEDIVRHCEKFQ